MTTMPIDNHPFTQRRLRFIGISVNRLTFKSIYIIQSSNNYNIVSSFICWDQNIVHMKILDTTFKMTKITFTLRGGKVCIARIKWNTSIKKLEDVNFLFLQGIRFNIFSITPTIIEVI